MSQKNVSLTVAGLEITTTEQLNPATPAWLAEALLLGQYWQSSGLLERLQRQVHVNRGRMGKYEVCDFVLLLLSYAVSGLNSLQAFFEQLSSVAPVLMAVWDRQHCPVASSLSRFLADVNNDAVEALRDLFEAALLEHSPINPDLGVTDRTGKQWTIFDVDGTTKAVRHRVLLTQNTHPTLKRRSRDSCKPGYAGRKRGEAVRTRTTIEQAHTHEWLGNFAEAGNCNSKEDLKRSCTIIEHYCQRTPSPLVAILRLDGLYGGANYVMILQQRQLMYMTRCRAYHLLKDPMVKAVLAAEPQQQYLHPDSPEVTRDLFDIDCLDATRRGYLEPMRLIVVRLIRFSKQKPSVGKCEGKYLYELFLTSLPASSFSAADVLSLYNGRGGFEQTLSEEDTEQDCDRWCSWQPDGQSFWQILSQWVWNWRIQAGWQSQSDSQVRQTLWSPALDTSETQDSSENSSKPTLEPNPPAQTVDPNLAPPPKYGAMVAVPGWGQSRHKYSGKDFKVIDDEAIECPAGHRMEQQQVRYNRVGDMQLMFGVKATICRACPLIQHCHADRSTNTRGRRILVTRPKLPTPPALKEVPDIIVKQSLSALRIGTQAVIWTDIPATQFRRRLKCNLERNQIAIEAISTESKAAAPSNRLLTRHQRAHRRLSWEQRLKRNQLQSKELIWKVQLFGISPTLAQFLKCPHTSDSQRS
jgi:hypothetical protein